MKWFILLFILVGPMFADPPDWYVDQSDGRGNCGPACAAMAINKISGLNLSSSDTREIIGYKYWDGRTSWDELIFILNRYEIGHYYIRVPTLEKLVSTVSNYHTLAIVLLDPNQITDKNYVYDSDANHYVILDGYNDGHFIVQDPFPGENYNNRYRVDQVWKSMTKDIIVIYE